MLYTHPADTASPTLAPLYDVVTTTVYPHRDFRSEPMLIDRTLGLKLNKERRYPTRDQLLKFAADVCHVREPQRVIERIATAMSQTLSDHGPRVDPGFLQLMTTQWDEGRLSVSR